MAYAQNGFHAITPPSVFAVQASLRHFFVCVHELGARRGHRDDGMRRRKYAGRPGMTKRSKFAALAGAAIFAALSSAVFGQGANPTLIGQYGDWGVYVSQGQKA